MKRILFFVFIAAWTVYGAEMAQFDSISKNLNIRNNYWSCSFIEGSMFPSNFVFADGSSAGAILFRDTVVQQGKEFLLFQERHAEKNIIKNTEDECIIELSGTYWRNISPLITSVKGLNVVCRYEFKRTKPTVKMIFKYTVNGATAIVFNNFFKIGWYYTNPFDKVIVDEKITPIEEESNIEKIEEAVSEDDKNNPPEKSNLIWNGKTIAGFANSQFKVQLETENVFAEVMQNRKVIACMLGKSETRVIKKNSVFTKRAFLHLQK